MVVNIELLPDVVIEYIFSYLSPYRDLKQCMLVSKAWYHHVQAVIRKTQRDFNHAIKTMMIEWYHLPAEPGPSISKRFSHSACCCGSSMYVFGGCTTANTTFNDLWRLDLATRTWIRPLATGTYPPPKACATLVCHEDNLILFGGWTHTSPYPLHQAWRIFNHLHIYNITTNRWTQIVTVCPGMAGHSATIQGDSMVVFGGFHCQRGGGPFSSSNEIWVLDLKTLSWTKHPTTSPQPLPRYGHSQINIDEKHILIVGGCGGPNMLLNDIWLLTLNDDPFKPWEWKEMEIEHKENGAPHLSFHPACKVSDQVIVLSKSQRSVTSASSLPLLLRAPSRIWVPPRADIQDARNNSTPSDVEKCVNGKKGVLKRHSAAGYTSSSDEEEYQYRTAAKKLANVDDPQSPDIEKNSSLDHFHKPQSSSSTGSTYRTENKQSVRDVLSSASASSSSSPNSHEGQPLPASDKSMLSIRPNSRRNRQRQLEGLDRMEQRLRDLCAKNIQRQPEIISSRQKPKKLTSPTNARNPMCIYVLDISKACSKNKVCWQPLQCITSYGPEEIILYSLVLGRGEIIMFGGIQKYLNSRQQEGECVPEVVSNAIYFLSATKSII